MQLHPHFLFNSLNTVSVLVREENTRAASRGLELLGDLFLGTSDGKDGSWASQGPVSS
jgi:sensor histidine kinase YesM